MSSSEIQAVYESLIADESLRAYLATSPDEESFVQRAVATARERGFEITPDALRSHLARTGGPGELSEKELEAVAGGYVSFGSSILCGFCGKTSGTCSLTVLKAAP